MIFGRSSKSKSPSKSGKNSSPNRASRSRSSGEGDKLQAKTRTSEESQKSVPHTPSSKEDTWASLFQGLESGKVQRAVEASEPSRPAAKAPAVSESVMATSSDSDAAMGRGRTAAPVRRQGTTDSTEGEPCKDRDAGFGPLSWRKDDDSECAEDRESVLDNVRA